MFKRLASATLLALLLSGLLTLTFNTGSVEGTWTGTVYIRADGSIDPPDAPVITYDNITYILTDNITSTADGIVVQRDNIIIDGRGYTVEGARAYPSTGIALPYRINVTIKDINVKNFDYGIFLGYSSNNKVVGNKIEGHMYGGVGLYLWFSSNNSIIGNVITGSYDGIKLVGSSNNIIFGNHVTANCYGIYLYTLYLTIEPPIKISSVNNIIYANNITNNDHGIVLEESAYAVITGNNIVNNGLGVVSQFLSSKNIIYHNNFINNTIQARDDVYGSLLWGFGPNVWNDDYPSGGNYWSDYNGTDDNGDGIGDTPYIIDRCWYVGDRYPLMSPWTPLPPVNITFIVPDDFPTIQEAINTANEGDRIYVRFGTYRENIVLNKSLTLLGEDRYITVIAGNAGSIVNITANSANLTGFTIKGGEIGVTVLDVSNATINNNRVLNNLYGLVVANSTQCTITYNILFNNTDIGLSLAYSSQSRVVGNTIVGNGNGIALGYSSNNTISENIVAANYAIGIMLGYSNNNIISQNYIIDNRFNSGLQFVNSTNNVISANTVERNKYGVGLQRSSNNIFYHNSFLYNDRQVCDTSWYYPDTSPSINVWDDGYPSGGNYWSDYVDRYPDAEELDGSGLWDTPYIIDENNQDRYPLMYPYGAQTYKLTIATTSGGTTNPSAGTHTYANGTTVSVTAIPNIGFSFDYWLLDGEKRTENPISVIMDANHTLEAYFVDDIPPEISDPWQDPPANNVQPFQNVTVWVNVTDYGAGVKNVTLWYSIDNGASWTILNMTALPIPSDTWITYEATIDGYENCTWVIYKIIAYDNAGNRATKDNSGYGYQYHVIPEGSYTPIFISLTLITLITTLWKTRRKRPQISLLLKLLKSAYNIKSCNF